jgi:hypothetical protein
VGATASGKEWRPCGRLAVENDPSEGAPPMLGLAHREASTMAALAVGPKTAQTYRETGSIRETARRWHTTREVVRRY